MQELLVLGLIPGTDFEITYNIWASFVGGVGAATAAMHAHKRSLFAAMLVSALITYQARRLQA